MDKPVPEAGPNDAIIKTTRALICTSDSHTVHGAIGPRENLTLGHEAVGVVHSVGSEVKLFRPGDRVVVGAITPDWGTPASQAGHSSQSGQALRLVAGSFPIARMVSSPSISTSTRQTPTWRTSPMGFSDDVAVYCCDMLSTGFVGAENANIPIGGTVAIFAQGPVGLMATAGAKLRGAGLIIAVDSIPARQELARFYGADVIVDNSKVDSVEQILSLTGGLGVDSAIEALGADITFQNAIAATKPGGTISNIGYHGQGEFVHIPRVAWGVGMAEKTIRTALCPGGSLRMERLLQVLLMKRIDPTKMTTHTFPFDQLDTAFDIMDKKKDGVIKPLITF